jgi:two-component system phosphate regulon response regulator PhoB
VIVLDLMLPDMSGIEVCRRLRSESSRRDVGVLILTARSDDYDRVLGFESGADDYVVKPFNVREVVLRVQALSRRVLEVRAARRGATGPRLQWKGISVDMGRQQAYLDGVEHSLRPLEFKLLFLFLQHPERTFSRKELLEEVWEIKADVQTRTVETHIRRLREGLGKYAEAVGTVPGFGYRLRTP